MTPIEEEGIMLAKAVMKLMERGFIGHDGLPEDEAECEHLRNIAHNSADWILKQAYPGRKAE